jgi:UDP-glucose 4-epimerase
MARPSTVLVTGGLGLIGHVTVRKLQAQGHDVIVTDICTNYGTVPQSEIDYLVQERRRKLRHDTQIYDVDIADQVGMDMLMRSHRPDIVIHMASFPRQKVVNANPMRGSRCMSEGLLNVLECCQRHGVDRFVYVSSSMVYGEFRDDVLESAQCHPQGQYGIMKLAGEWLVRDYTRRGSFNHVIIRPSAVYGELDVEDRVISRFLVTAMRDGTLKVNGATETLDFTYVEDAADGIVEAAVKPVARNKTYNITRSNARTLLDAAHLAVKIAGRGRVEVHGRDQDFPSRGSLNIHAARRDLGFNPQVDIEQGFQKYHDWLKDSIYWSPKTI